MRKDSLRQPASEGRSAGHPFLDRQLRFSCVLFSSLVLLTSAASAFTAGPAVWQLIPVVLSILLSVWICRRANPALDALGDIFSMLKSANRGDLHVRITGTERLGEVGRVAWELNDFLDKIESYFKEVDTCFRHVTEGKYDRKAQYRGMPGLLRESLIRINSSLEELKKGSEFLAANALHSELHSLNTQHLITNLEQNQSDLLQISEEMAQVENIAAQNGDAASLSQESVRNMVEALGSINQTIHAVSEVVEKISHDSDRITQSLSIIKDIADQTDLLALNASIEAARAGEEGRGFAVVAGEVKALSRRTKDTANEVSEIMHDFGHRVASMADQASQSREGLEQLETITHELDGRFDEFASAAQQTQRAVSHAKDRTFGTLVKADHIIFKQQGYVALSDSENHDEAMAATSMTHVHCRLGEWYSDAGRTFAYTQAYKKIEKPHRIVHESVQHAVSLRDADWKRDTRLRDEIVNAMRLAEDESYKILQYMDDMIDEQHANH